MCRVGLHKVCEANQSNASTSLQPTNLAPPLIDMTLTKHSECSLRYGLSVSPPACHSCPSIRYLGQFWVRLMRRTVQDLSLSCPTPLTTSKVQSNYLSKDRVKRWGSGSLRSQLRIRKSPPGWRLDVCWTLDFLRGLLNGLSDVLRFPSIWRILDWSAE